MTKEERRIIAEEHHKYTKEKFSEETKNSISLTSVHDKAEMTLETNNEKIVTTVVDMTSENAIFKYSDKKTCVLNFASFTRVGGGFIKGSIAQEEALCHASNLYDVLLNFKVLYDNNFFDKKRLNHGLYTNFALYSPNICFIDKENVVNCDVITCAAPNLSVYGKDDETYRDALYSRIKFILNTCELQGVKTLILGAFGCGVFKNEPKVVATIFKDILTKYSYSFEKVVFAIPSGNKNLDVFNEVFNS